MKCLAVLLLLSTIMVRAEAADLSQQIAKYNLSLDKQTVQVVSRELKHYPPVMIYIARRESSFNPKAHSRGCIGLTGVNSKVWSKTLIEKGIIRSSHDLWTVKYNLKAGWYIFKYYNKSYRRYRGL